MEATDYYEIIRLENNYATYLFGNM